jgi:hypothetical protein
MMGRSDDVSRSLALTKTELVQRQTSRDYQRSPGKIFRVATSQSAKNSDSATLFKRPNQPG